MKSITWSEVINRAIPTLALLGVLAIWEICVVAFAVNPVVLPKPSAVFVAIIDRRGLLFAFSQVTLFEILVGFVAAIAVGIPLGIFVFFSNTAKRTIYPLLVASQMVPKVAIAPIFVIWFGLGLAPKVVISALIAFFPIVIATIVGLELVDRDMMRLFRSMGAGRLTIFFKLQLPTALPNIFAGLKIGMSLAVVGAIVGEFVSADRGLGYYLLYADGQLDTVGVFSGLILLTAMGVVLYFMIEIIQRFFVAASSVVDQPVAATM